MKSYVGIAVVGLLLALLVTRIYFVHGQTTLVTNPPGAGASMYLNGTVQGGARCDFVTGTTSAAGTATVNITGMGYSSLIGIPQVSLTSSSIGIPIITSYSATSISVLAQGTNVVSILGINVTTFSNSALSFSVLVCGV